MPNRQQAIIWTNDGIVNCCIYTSLGFNELHMSHGVTNTEHRPEFVLTKTPHTSRVSYEMSEENILEKIGHAVTEVTEPKYWRMRWPDCHDDIIIFSVLLAHCAGNSPVTGEFPAQRPVTWGFDVFFDLRLNKWLSTQSWGWWFEMLPRSLWRHCNG